MIAIIISLLLLFRYSFLFFFCYFKLQWNNYTAKPVNSGLEPRSSAPTVVEVSVYGAQHTHTQYSWMVTTTMRPNGRNLIFLFRIEFYIYLLAIFPPFIPPNPSLHLIRYT